MLQVRTMPIILALGIATASEGACGMSQSIGKPAVCRVIDGDKLPSDIGGPQALCAVIEAAIREKAPGTPYAVELRVLSAHSLAADVRLGNGQTLPEQKMAVSDRQLNRGSIERFAAAIASEIAKAGGR